ncbi:MAG: Flp family type IVb pilin [Chloroflexota bacterium]
MTVFWLALFRLRSGVRMFVRDERAAGLVEYALIIAVLAVAVIAALAFLAGGLGDVFEMVSDTLEGVTTNEDPVEVGRRRGRGWCKKFGC